MKVAKNRGEAQVARERMFTGGKRLRRDADNSLSLSSSSTALLTKSQQDYAAILDVGKYLPKESLVERGIQRGWRSKPPLLLATHCRRNGGSCKGGGDDDLSVVGVVVVVACRRCHARKSKATGWERTG